MGNNRITGVEVVNPYLVAMLIRELGLNESQKRATPKPRETKVQPIESASPPYDSQGRLPHHPERPPLYNPLDIYA